MMQMTAMIRKAGVVDWPNGKVTKGLARSSVEQHKHETWDNWGSSVR